MSKRIVSLILCLALCVIAFSPCSLSASTDAKNAALELYGYGLFSGTGTDAYGNPEFDLDRQPTRNEAITMLVRLIGKASAAQGMTYTAPFTDVQDWAKPYVNYAYKNSLAAGTSDTTFGGDSLTTPAQYVTFVLRALGYSSGTDFQWDNPFKLADDIGVTKGQYNANSYFTRGDVAVFSRNALYAYMKGTKTTLLDHLGITIPDPQPQPQPSPGGFCTEAEAVYILNKNTHKFHYPWCSSVKQMKDKNKLFWNGTRDAVIDMGYSACKNCKP